MSVSLNKVLIPARSLRLIFIARIMHLRRKLMHCTCRLEVMSAAKATCTPEYLASPQSVLFPNGILDKPHCTDELSSRTSTAGIMCKSSATDTGGRANEGRLLSDSYCPVLSLSHYEFSGSAVRLRSKVGSQSPK